jgi:hypothetical protein
MKWILRCLKGIVNAHLEFGRSDVKPTVMLILILWIILTKDGL